MRGSWFLWGVLVILWAVIVFFLGFGAGMSLDAT
jgi:hypothetical protein